MNITSTHNNLRFSSAKVWIEKWQADAAEALLASMT
jgi:hypothetical protein